MTYKLKECVVRDLDTYLNELDDLSPTMLHNMFMQQVESVLIEQVLIRAGNQVKAAKWLGLNRNTLRKKLMQYGLLKIID